MNVELIILGVSFALVVVAFIGFVVTLVRAARHTDEVPLHPRTAIDATPGDGFDASLEGLRVDISPTAPSAVLHAPLRFSEWQPVDSAVTGVLPTVRAANENVLVEPVAAPVAPLPAAPTPAAVAMPVVEPAPAALPIAAPEPFPLPIAAPEPVIQPSPVAQPAPVAAVPEPMPVAAPAPEPMAAPAPVTVPVVPDEFSAEIASLLPSADTAAEDGEPGVDESLDSLIRNLGGNQAPESTSADSEESAELSFDLTDEFLATTVPAEPALVPIVNALAEQVIPTPAQIIPVPVAPSTLTPITRPEPADTEPITAEDLASEWEGLLGTQRPAPTEPRPVAVPAAARPASGRPVVRVAGSVANAEERVLAATSQSRELLAEVVPDLVMEAPVEMWFGDARVGVKAGTATYDRFRKYADVLLHDLPSNSTP